MHTASSYLPVHVVRPALNLFDGILLLPHHPSGGGGDDAVSSTPSSTASSPPSSLPISIPPKRSRDTSGYQQQSSWVISWHVKKGTTFCICWPLKYNRRAPLKLRNNVSLSRLTLRSYQTFCRCADEKHYLYVRYIVKRYFVIQMPLPPRRSGSIEALLCGRPFL